MLWRSRLERARRSSLYDGHHVTGGAAIFSFANSRRPLVDLPETFSLNIRSHPAASVPRPGQRSPEPFELDPGITEFHESPHFESLSFGILKVAMAQGQSKSLHKLHFLKVGE